MAEDLIKRNEDHVEKDTSSAEALIKLKENSVSKVEYDKVVAENKKYADYILNGSIVPADAVEKAKKGPDKTLAEVNKEFSQTIFGNCCNLDGFKKSLEQRKIAMENGLPDPYMNPGVEKLDPNFGERVAETLQEYIDASDDNPVQFQALFAGNIK